VVAEWPCLSVLPKREALKIEVADHVQERDDQAFLWHRNHKEVFENGANNQRRHNANDEAYSVFPSMLLNMANEPPGIQAVSEDKAEGEHIGPKWEKSVHELPEVKGEVDNEPHLPCQIEKEQSFENHVIIEKKHGDERDQKKECEQKEINPWKIHIHKGQEYYGDCVKTHRCVEGQKPHQAPAQEPANRVLEFL
jgi:hypothetical protein